MFADRAKIYVRSGKGGDGHVSFRREKYVANGGPDGGDGGKGGDVIIEVDPGMNTLINFRHIRKYSAEDGERGGKRNCRGKNGQDCILKVPEGTVFKELNSDQIIVDMSGENKRFVLLHGGRGGNGNQHYATSTMQAPKYAQPGQPAQELELSLELKVIADVGLIGFPNVGKSTFLSKVSNARPEIANYHFTTLRPHLGVVDLDDTKSFVMADIPGLIEGASKGVGLGHDFLKHIERTKLLLHIVDAASTEGRDAIEDIKTINRELSSYSDVLSQKPQIIALNKIDAIAGDVSHAINRIKAAFDSSGYEIYPISAVAGTGMKELLYHISDRLSQMSDEVTVFEQEYFIDRDALNQQDPYTVSYDEETAMYVIEGPRVEKMLGYTNLDSEKGFIFFQKFLKDTGILDELEALGIKEGDTVRMYGHVFDYYQ